MSDNGSNIEVFTAEYRHEVVEKFVRDLISGYSVIYSSGYESRTHKISS
jgi:hypothetical protein